MIQRFGLMILMVLTVAGACPGGAAETGTSRFQGIEIAPGMNREKVEQQIFALLGTHSRYTVHCGSEGSGITVYRDGEWVLEVQYRKGQPGLMTDFGGISHPPIDATVLGFRMVHDPQRLIHQVWSAWEITVVGTESSAETRKTWYLLRSNGEEAFLAVRDTGRPATDPAAWRIVYYIPGLDWAAGTEIAPEQKDAVIQKCQSGMAATLLGWGDNRLAEKLLQDGKRR